MKLFGGLAFGGITIFGLLAIGMCGWIAGKIMHKKTSLIGNILLGILGGIVGSVLFKVAGFSINGATGNMISAILGACILIFIFNRGRD